MLYYSDENVLIRDLMPGDAECFVREEIKQGWIDATADKYEMRLAHCRKGKCISLVAEYCGQPAGYVSVYPNCPWGALGGQGYAEIIDFAVLEKYRCKGIGS